eukprot:CAMPEP_0113575566 /NCGR_PEP_ID=MMETSP0015_2-20120614/27771_1 /TAXON_ID=2838 /ORGANISM="Odontella" /LENGTH=236 /DNA_ID=CAMNT_0000478823 /DNA_START=94 /DNA_END=801 /DNA_ORIENTATION=+ /assembly_acc=CAM_ASM_000160
MAKPKTIYLIRHAESLENQRISCLKQTFRSIRRFNLPDGKDVRTGAQLLNVAAQVDSEVSERGIKQIKSMSEKIKEDNFIAERGVQLAVHSPLLRARQTCDGMLGCCDEGGNEEQHRAPGRPEAIQLPCLAEKTLSEWIPGNNGPMLGRIGDFETWLSGREEQVVAVVGHSQYFKAMLGLPFKFGNCEVWRLEFDPNRCINGRESSISNGSAEEKKDDVDGGVDGEPLIKVLPRGW